MKGGCAGIPQSKPMSCSAAVSQITNRVSGIDGQKNPVRWVQRVTVDAQVGAPELASRNMFNSLQALDNTTTGQRQEEVEGNPRIKEGG